MDKKILLSFDVEEFDIAREYGLKISGEDEMRISLNGLKNVLKLLDKLNLRATFFVTSNFALKNPAIIKKISEKHEVCSHAFYHSSFELEDLKKSREILEKITEREVGGFRMPRLMGISDNAVKDAGYKYNSSMSPSYMPGRYNNFFKSRKYYWTEEMLNIPTSVVPLVRFPLNWLTLKNIPMSLFKFFSSLTLTKDKYLNIYFHPWEFTDLSYWKLPTHVKRYSGENLTKRLEEYLVWLKKRGEFVCFGEFVGEVQKNEI